ncbi:uncharacterized protein SCHCODRAFT_02734814 [Schizophyllum commune H4-8]|uniref:Expressed protein n=1 Tax=Schizophyllum commune (strain H4-8 / FGSC 9210) TaxID=578458 RepID=D8Q8C7_SCHCM|nr:uncharacterized protein SCHCODRAFT_02734814 [Schizophyllum commune H4-8]KAI5891106.1 hypothetical protein SCHCODRAFT_02734814 [Schizophyllum commune H4-8]
MRPLRRPQDHRRAQRAAHDRLGDQRRESGRARRAGQPAKAFLQGGSLGRGGASAHAVAYLAPPARLPLPLPQPPTAPAHRHRVRVLRRRGLPPRRRLRGQPNVDAAQGRGGGVRELDVGGVSNGVRLPCSPCLPFHLSSYPILSATLYHTLLICTCAPSPHHLYEKRVYYLCMYIRAGLPTDSLFGLDASLSSACLFTFSMPLCL